MITNNKDIAELLDHYERLSIRDQSLASMIMILLYKLECVEMEVFPSKTNTNFKKMGLYVSNKDNTTPIPYTEKNNVIYFNFTSVGGDKDE